jgi:hypothetical protein
VVFIDIIDKATAILIEDGETLTPESNAVYHEIYANDCSKI